MVSFIWFLKEVTDRKSVWFCTKEYQPGILTILVSNERPSTFFLKTASQVGFADPHTNYNCDSEFMFYHTKHFYKSTCAKTERPKLNGITMFKTKNKILL